MTILTTPRSRRYTVQGLVCLGLIGSGAWALVTNLQSDAQAQTVAPAIAQDQAPGLDMAVYSDAQRIRRSAGLSAMDLAALQLSQAECEAVLGRLVTWCETNGDALANADARVHAAQREQNNLHRATRTGQASEIHLASRDQVAQVLAQAVDTRDQLMEQGAAYAMQAVPGRGVAWQRATQLRGDAPTELRYVSTMDSDRLQSLEAEAQRLGQGVEQVLSFSEKQEVTAIRQRLIQQMPLVRAAEEVALPLPEELRTPEEALTDLPPASD